MVLISLCYLFVQQLYFLQTSSLSDGPNIFYCDFSVSKLNSTYFSGWGSCLGDEIEWWEIRYWFTLGVGWEIRYWFTLSVGWEIRYWFTLSAGWEIRYWFTLGVGWEIRYRVTLSVDLLSVLIYSRCWRIYSRCWRIYSRCWMLPRCNGTSSVSQRSSLTQELVSFCV